MSEYSPYQEIENEVRAAVAVPNASIGFVNSLREELITQADNQFTWKPRVNRLRLSWAIPLTLVFFMVVATLVIGPQRVWAAVRGLLGYLPGVGYVQTDGSLRVLAEPVMLERCLPC